MTSTYAVQRTNLLPNPGMSKAAPAVTRTNQAGNPQPSPTYGTTGWSAYITGGAAAFTTQATGGPIGGPFLRWTVTTASASNGGPYYACPNGSAVAGQPHTASVWVRSSAAVTLTPAIEWHASSGSTISTVNGAAVSLAANTWTRVAVTGTAPAGTDHVTLTLYGGAATTVGTTVDVAMLLVEAASAVGDYFDGDTAATATRAFAWTGAAGGSTSTDTTGYVEVRRNWHPNPGVEGGSIGWGTLLAGVTGSTTTSTANLGTTAYQAVCDGTAAQQGLDAYTATSSAAQLATTPYSGSLALRASAPVTLDAYVRVTYTDASYVQGATVSVAATTAWQTVALPAATPAAGKAIATVAIYARTHTATAVTLYGDCALIEAAPTAGAYFDATSTDPTGTWVWELVPGQGTPGGGPYTTGPVVQRAAKVGGWQPNGSAALYRIAGGFDGPAGASMTVRAPAAGGSGVGACYPVTLPAPGTYTLSGYVQPTAGLEGAFHVYKGGGSDPAADAPVTLVAGQWTRFSLTFTASADGPVMAYFYNNQAVSGAYGFLLDGVLLEAGATVGSYFDGDTVSPVAPATAFAWTGTAGASASVFETLLTPPGMLAAAGTGKGGFLQLGSALWGLGSFDTPDVIFNGVDTAGVRWALAAVQGWKTTTAETPVVRAAGMDGGWFAPGTRAPRVLTLTGVFGADTAAKLRAAEDQLRAATEHLAEDTTLWVDASMTGGRQQQMTVRLTGALEVVDVSPFVRTFSAVMTAADPLKYAAGAAGLVTLTTGMAQTTGSFGAGFPAAFPLSFASGLTSSGGRIAAINSGTVPVWPVVTFTAGPDAVLDTPLLRHLSLGVTEGVGAVMQPGSVAVFDNKARSVLLNGRSAYGTRAGGTVFFPLAPGENDLSFSANSYTATAQVSVSFRPAWS